MTMTVGEAADVAKAILKCGFSDALKGEILLYLNSSEHLPFVWVLREQNIEIYRTSTTHTTVGRDDARP